MDVKARIIREEKEPLVVLASGGVGEGGRGSGEGVWGGEDGIEGEKGDEGTGMFRRGAGGGGGFDGVGKGLALEVRTKDPQIPGETRT